MADLARLSCSNCGAALPYVAGQEHYQCGYCGASYVIRRNSGHLELERLDEKLDNVHAGVQDLLDRVGDATLHGRLASELAIRRLREDAKGYQAQESALNAEINGLQAQIDATNTEIPALENQINELERARVRIYLRRGSGQYVFLLFLAALLWGAWLLGWLDRSPGSPLMDFLADFEGLPADSIITALNILMALVPLYVVFALLARQLARIRYYRREKMRVRHQQDGLHMQIEQMRQSIPPKVQVIERKQAELYEARQALNRIENEIRYHERNASRGYSPDSSG